nr:hypothetical protein [Vibrio cincinnatiensis]
MVTVLCGKLVVALLAP